MPDNERYKQQYMAEIQPHVQEQVVAVGMLNRAGAMARMGVRKVSPLASMVMGKKAKNASGGMPENVLVGITPTKVHLFSFKFRGRGVAVKELVDTWDRSDMQVAINDKATATRVKVTLPSEGREIEMEAMKGSGFNDEMLEQLTGVGIG